MKKYLLLSVYILSALACGLTMKATPTPSALQVTATVAPLPVKFVPPTVAPSATVSAGAAGKPVKCAVGDVNIRKGPSVESTVKGWLYKGDCVTIAESVGGWLRLEGGGYVKAEWLK